MSIKLALIIGLVISILLIYQIGSHFKKSEKTLLGNVTVKQRRGYYLAFVGAIILGILVIFTYIMFVVYVLSPFSETPFEDTGGLFSLLTNVFGFLFEVLLINMLITIFSIAILVNGTLAVILLKFVKPTHFINEELVSMILAIIFLFFIRMISIPIVDSLLHVTQNVNPDDVLYQLVNSDSFEKMATYSVNGLVMVGVLLIVIGGVINNLEKRKFKTTVEK